MSATTRQVALAWLLQRSPNILIIAGTSSVEHLRDNLKAVSLVLPADIVAQPDSIAVLNAQEKPKGSGGDDDFGRAADTVTRRLSGWRP